MLIKSQAFFFLVWKLFFFFGTSTLRIRLVKAKNNRNCYLEPYTCIKLNLISYFQQPGPDLAKKLNTLEVILFDSSSQVRCIVQKSNNISYSFLLLQ